jgi:hypothetical protein
MSRNEFLEHNKDRAIIKVDIERNNINISVNKINNK